MHVRLFKLYPTSFSCHSSWHVQNLQEISCCLYSEIRVIPQPYTTLYRALTSLKPIASIPRDVYHEIRLWKSQNWQHRDVQFCRTLRTNTLVDHGDLPLREVINWSRSPLCTPAVRHIFSWPSFTQIWIDSHPIAWCFLFLLLPVLRTFLNVRPGSWFRWLQLQRRSWLTGVCVAAESRQGAHCMKHLSFGSIQPQSHLEEVFREIWLAVVEVWGRWLRTEVGSAEDYIVSYKSKWNEWLPTCTFNSSWILRCIAAGDCNGHAISVSWSDVVCLFTGLHRHERQLISHVWEIWQGDSSTERTSGEVCLNTSPGSYMNHTLIIKL